MHRESTKVTVTIGLTVRYICIMTWKSDCWYEWSDYGQTMHRECNVVTRIVEYLS